MSARTSLPLLAGLAFALAGCYTHYPYGPYGGPYAPVYTAPPATLPPGTVISPGYESLGTPSTSPGGTFQPPTYNGSPSSYRGGDYYQPDEQSQSRKFVPEYDDINGPGTSGSGGGSTFGSENTTPFGPQGGTDRTARSRTIG
ncbi:MAG TPA: hypothetical protein VML55_02460 [Planctomycetaceae bacterium]|nr:hypothetical protein [Planctomycetaceae bacterium]